jgi:hypothetical protein
MYFIRDTYSDSKTSIFHNLTKDLTVHTGLFVLGHSTFNALPLSLTALDIAVLKITAVACVSCLPLPFPARNRHLPSASDRSLGLKHLNERRRLHPSASFLYATAPEISIDDANGKNFNDTYFTAPNPLHIIANVDAVDNSDLALVVDGVTRLNGQFEVLDVERQETFFQITENKISVQGMFK